MPHDLSYEENLINLTMSYRLDADILFPYGETTETASGNIVAPRVDVKWREPDNDFFGNFIFHFIFHQIITSACIRMLCKTFEPYSVTQT